MLDDRYYMRHTPFDSRRSATVILVIINVAVFVLQALLGRFSNFPVNYYFALSLHGLKEGYLWQILTYAFMHAGLLHLLFNCWAIFVFGQAVEEALGRKPFVALYLTSGIVGGLVQTLVGLVDVHFSGAVVGASAAAFGLAAAFATIFPDRLLLLFFIIPMRAKWLLILGGALSIFGILYPTDNIAHAAHLGGMLAGLFFVRYAIHWDWSWLARLANPPPRRVTRTRPGGNGLWNSGGRGGDDDLPADEFLSREVDPILDKISAHGIQSLTERERRILEAARAKMAKR